MSDDVLSIGRLAARSGCKVQTIRYYESVGLLAPPPRSAGNQRRYRARDAERLAFIRHSRELGFSLDAIRQLLALADEPERPCAEADAIARHHLAEVEDRMARLAALKAELERMIAACGGDTVGRCRVIETLADHTRCAGDHGPAPALDRDHGAAAGKA